MNPWRFARVPGRVSGCDRGCRLTGFSREYDRWVSADPLKSALEEIAPRLDTDLEPLMKALQGEGSVEEAWEVLLQETLNEA